MYKIYFSSKRPSADMYNGFMRCTTYHGKGAGDSHRQLLVFKSFNLIFI